jgi:hypothetical protein
LDVGIEKTRYMKRKRIEEAEKEIYLKNNKYVKNMNQNRKDLRLMRLSRDKSEKPYQNLEQKLIDCERKEDSLMCQLVIDLEEEIKEEEIKEEEIKKSKVMWVKEDPLVVDQPYLDDGMTVEYRKVETSQDSSQDYDMCFFSTEVDAEV